MTVSRYGIERPASGCFTVGLVQAAANHQETNHAIHKIPIAETGFITALRITNGSEISYTPANSPTKGRSQ